MKCGECEENTGEPVRVEYTTGNTEILPLCEDCRTEFLDGGFIHEVESTGAE